MTDLPTWDGFNVPVLTVLGDGVTRSLRELRRDVADLVGLSVEQRAEALPSGQLRADNRIGWAASYLNRVDALDRPSRGRYVITDFGQELLRDHPGGIAESDLKRFAKEGDEWWLSRSSPEDSGTRPEIAPATELDPTEQVEEGVARIHEEVGFELLSRLIEQDPAFFEEAAAFRDGAVQASGTAITKILPPVSRFGERGGHAAKKQTVLGKLGEFFDRFFGLS
jgi:restriction system protein